MTQKFTAEEVLAEAQYVRAYSSNNPGTKSDWERNADMLTAYADALSKPASPMQVDIYPLPDSLYPQSKDWMAADYAGRVEWLHAMYENRKDELDCFLAAQEQGDAAAYCCPDDPYNSTAFSWPGTARVLSLHTMPLYTHPTPPASPVGVPDVAAMVDRFLGWALPKDFAPDAGINYNPAVNINQTTGEPYPNTPSGTNLFTAEQAEAMFRYVLAAAPSAPEGGHIDRARFKKAPCYLCGYNGPGYYQPKTHSCADKYHAAAPEGDGGGE